MINDPPKMDHRRPNLSFTIGIKGSERIAPREYAAAMMPLSEPWGLSKSVSSYRPHQYSQDSPDTR